VRTESQRSLCIVGISIKLSNTGTWHPSGCNCGKIKPISHYLPAPHSASFCTLPINAVGLALVRIAVMAADNLFHRAGSMNRNTTVHRDVVKTMLTISAVNIPPDGDADSSARNHLFPINRHLRSQRIGFQRFTRHDPFPSVVLPLNCQDSCLFQTAFSTTVTANSYAGCGSTAPERTA